MEQIIHELLLALLILTTSDITVEQLAASPLPQVYIVPHQQLVQSACGCNCGLQGAYFGSDNHVLLLGGHLNPSTGEVELAITPQTKALIIHELQHYVQHLINPDQYMAMQGTDEHQKQYRREAERQAYQLMNIYATFNNLPPFDVEKLTEFSVNAAGNPECPPGETIAPGNERTRISDLIEFYDRGTIAYYEQRDRVKWNPYVVDMFITCFNTD